jgi:Dolichyl-phosphate-mannose-protein mannosyltransferase
MNRVTSLSGVIRLPAAVLTGAFLWQMLAVTNREVITNDEGFHTYAGYRYWQCADFGVNPEHPPLAKMVAGLVLQIAKIPAPSGPCPVVSTAKGSGYADSAEWLYSSTGPSTAAKIDRVIPLARRGMATFALLLAVTAFFFTRRMFGDLSALVGLALIAFEPTLVAHGSLVTTDMALSATSLLAVASFFLFHRRRTLQMLLLAGFCCGLALSVKHSGVLIIPTLLLLAFAELAFDWNRGEQSRTSKVLKEAAAVLFILFLGFVVLWATYHFRYAARPDGAQMAMSLSDFMADTQAKENHSVILKTIPFLAHHHLLPEAYLYGFVDVLSISDPGQSAFLFGHLYPHGVPQYFPCVILIKTTLGMITLALLSLLASRKYSFDIRPFYFLAPSLVWLLAGIVSTLNIGYRHILPVIAPACCLIGVAIVHLWRTNGRLVRSAIVILMVAHVASSLAAFPNELAYGNEIFGGVSNSHNLLTDSNNDWGQALPQVATWLKDNQVSDCSFAYDGFARPDHSGIGCNRIIANLFELNGDKGEAQLSRVQSGTFIISGLSWSGIEWERPDLNPYEVFQKAKPRAVIGGADMVYTGTFDMSRVIAVNQLAQAMRLNGEKQFSQALEPAEAAAHEMPTSSFAHLALANALAGLGLDDQAHQEYQKAETIAASQPEWYFLQRAEIRAGLAATGHASR